MKRKFSRFIPLLVCSTVFLFILILTKSGAFTQLEYNSYDSRIKFSADFSKTSDDIIIIMVDQYSITGANENYGWNWPWPREAYGEILEFLDKGKAKSCTYDILFPETSIYGDEDDEAFAEKLKNAKNTKPYLAQFWDAEDTVTKPLPVLAESASDLSNTTSVKDSDGIIRRTRIKDNFNGEDLIFMGFTPVKDKLEKSPVKGAVYDSKKQTQTVKLNFKKDIDLYAHYSAFDILESSRMIKEGEDDPYFYPEDFENAHVFVIYYAPGLFDICSTPVSKVYPGAGVSITALDNYLNNDFIKDVPQILNILIIAAACILGTTTSWFSGKRKKTIFIVLSYSIFFLLGIGLIIFSAYSIFLKGFDMWFIPVLAGFILSFLVMTSTDYFNEGKQKRFIKSAFSQYLSPNVINQLIANPDKLKLGGEKKNITIFFSDVQSFTTLSEGLSPEKLTDLLNFYLSEMSSIILETGGTIDKYEGDAIIAFWNAPADIKDHGKHALEAAIKCQEKLSQLEESFISKVGRPMWTRIGINTGNAVVGNMGSQNRFDYTMFGDSVNLASRLEGLNKQFGTYLMCSESTMKHAIDSGCDLKFRELGRVQVVGKKQAVRVFEPMTKEKFEADKITLKKFDDALELFYKGDLKKAAELFEENSSDAPSRKYAERIHKILDENKNYLDQWNGIWIAGEK